MNMNLDGSVVPYTGTDVILSTLNQDILVKTSSTMQREQMYLRATFTNTLVNYFKAIDIPLALVVFKVDPVIILL